MNEGSKVDWVDPETGAVNAIECPPVPLTPELALYTDNAVHCPVTGLFAEAHGVAGEPPVLWFAPPAKRKQHLAFQRYLRLPLDANGCSRVCSALREMARAANTPHHLPNWYTLGAVATAAPAPPPAAPAAAPKEAVPTMRYCPPSPIDTPAPSPLAEPQALPRSARASPFARPRESPRAAPRASPRASPWGSPVAVPTMRYGMTPPASPATPAVPAESDRARTAAVFSATTPDAEGSPRPRDHSGADGQPDFESRVQSLVADAGGNKTQLLAGLAMFQKAVGDSSPPQSGGAKRKRDDYADIGRKSPINQRHTVEEALLSGKANAFSKVLRPDLVSFIAVRGWMHRDQAESWRKDDLIGLIKRRSGAQTRSVSPAPTVGSVTPTRPPTPTPPRLVVSDPAADEALQKFLAPQLPSFINSPAKTNTPGGRPRGRPSAASSTPPPSPATPSKKAPAARASTDKGRKSK
eukprot:Hpha_TRINITY_DN12339_c0_g1::TRINITY_DN12339_c0_g1_i1::g.155771::m.155771